MRGLRLGKDHQTHYLIEQIERGENDGKTKHRDHKGGIMARLNIEVSDEELKTLKMLALEQGKTLKDLVRQKLGLLAKPRKQN